MANNATFSLWRPHPWHGLSAGPAPPGTVNAYIEICPFDLVKYEMDKTTGYLHVDRPQLTSSQPPTLYGFIPRTYCGERVGALMEGAHHGDGDPLDICVLSDRPINRADVILTAHVVGGLPMVDSQEADDKIVAVLARDPLWEHVTDIGQLPQALIDRLLHYFETYKLVPGQEADVSIGPVYGREHAQQVIEAAMQDYRDAFPDQA